MIVWYISINGFILLPSLVDKRNQWHILVWFISTYGFKTFRIFGGQEESVAYCKEAVSVLVGVDWNSISQRSKIFGGQEESVAHCCLVHQYTRVQNF